MEMEEKKYQIDLLYKKKTNNENLIFQRHKNNFQCIIETNKTNYTNWRRGNIAAAATTII